MLVQSRQRVFRALLGSAMLATLPLATGCQSAQFSGKVPGFGWVSGWWGKPDAANEPTKPPAGFEMPSSKADPTASAYAGGSRTPSGGYANQDRSKTTGSYAAGDRANPSNWGGPSRPPSAAGYSASLRGEEEGYASAGAAKGNSSAARPAGGGYDPYGDTAPSTDSPYGASARDAGYAASARGDGYSARMASTNQRATRSSLSDDDMYGEDEGDAYSASSTGNRFSTGGGYGAEAPRSSGRSSASYDDEDSMMTADDELENSYPRTSGYGSGYRVPATRSAPSNDRRYPSSKSSDSYDDDYGMSEDDDSDFGEDSKVQKVAATEQGRYGLSAKAASMLERPVDGEFRPGSTGRVGASRTSAVSRAGYDSLEEEKPAASTASRYSNRFSD